MFSIRSGDSELHWAVGVLYKVGRTGTALGSGSVALRREIRSCIRQWECSTVSGREIRFCIRQWMCSIRSED